MCWLIAFHSARLTDTLCETDATLLPFANDFKALELFFPLDSVLSLFKRDDSGTALRGDSRYSSSHSAPDPSLSFPSSVRLDPWQSPITHVCLFRHYSSTLRLACQLEELDCSRISLYWLQWNVCTCPERRFLHNCAGAMSDSVEFCISRVSADL